MSENWSVGNVVESDGGDGVDEEWTIVVVLGGVGEMCSEKCRCGDNGDGGEKLS